MNKQAQQEFIRLAASLQIELPSVMECEALVGRRRPSQGAYADACFFAEAKAIIRILEAKALLKRLNNEGVLPQRKTTCEPSSTSATVTETTENTQASSLAPAPVLDLPPL